MLYLLILFASLDAFARAPEADSARNMVEQVVETILNEETRARWVEDNFVARGSDGEVVRITPEQAVGLLTASRYGGTLYEGVSKSEVVSSVVSGPDYVRVVLSGEIWFSFVVVLFEGRLQIIDWSSTNCGQCAEPTRFLTDLIHSVNSQSTGIYRLLPGVELVRSDSERLSARYPSWVRAFHARNVTAGYTRSILSGARVIGNSGNNVHVELSSGREVWPLSFKNGRWVLLYDELEEASVLRLAHSDEAAFTSNDAVAALRSELWEPVAIEIGNQTLLDRDLLYLEPRRLYSDIVMYGQEIGRRWAQVAVVELRSLRPILAVSAPTISSRLKVDISGWTDEFSFSLSPNERHLLIGGYTHVWVVDLETGDVLWEESDFRAVSSLGWAGGGDRFAIAECRNFANDEARRSPSESVGSCINGEVRSYDFVSDQVSLTFTTRLPGHRSSIVLYDGDNLWSASDTGNVITIPLGDRIMIDHEEQTSCEQFEAGRYQPSLRQLLYTCISAADVLEDGRTPPPIRRVVTIDLITHQVNQPVYQEVGSVERVISVSPSGGLLLVANANSTQVVRVADGARFRVTDTRLYNPQWSFDELSIYGIDPVGNGSRWSVVSMSD